MLVDLTESEINNILTIINQSTFKGDSVEEIASIKNKLKQPPKVETE